MRPYGQQPTRLLGPQNSLGKNTGVGCHFLLQSCITGRFFTTSAIWGRRQWQPTPILLPGKSHGRRSLVGCSPWGHSESDTTERLHFHFSLSCIGEGNGNPLQCSCLENPRDTGAWWADIYEVTQSWTRLKRLSSSHSSSSRFKKIEIISSIFSNHCYKTRY